MITTIDKATIDFICKHGLTFNQFCILLLIHQGDVSLMLKYQDQVGFLAGGTVLKADKTRVNEMEDLITRKFLLYNPVDADKYALDNYSVTAKFTKGFLDKFDDYAEELWKAYPSKILFGNDEKNIAKAVDYEEYKEKYIKILKKDISIHPLAIGAVKRMGKYAPMQILKFVGARHWENMDKNEGKRSIRIH